jgi:hypothetical protein
MAGLLSGEKLPLKVDTGVALVTKANIDTPEMKALLQ